MAQSHAESPALNYRATAWTSKVEEWGMGGDTVDTLVLSASVTGPVRSFTPIRAFDLAATALGVCSRSSGVVAP